MNFKTIHAPHARKIASSIAVLLALLGLYGCPKIVQAQVPVTLGPVPKAQFLDNAGAPLAGGKVYTYKAGTNVQLATYTDSTGTVVNSNPIILDAAGRASIWFQGQAYKIVVDDSSGSIIYTVDNFLVQPFLAANNSWTGNETHSGTETFNGAVTFTAGGAMSGTYTGSPNFSGNPTFNGNPVFTNAQEFPSGVKTDTITGLTAGSTLGITGKAGGAAVAGEGVELQAGASGAGAAGGGITLLGSNGSATGGAGGGISAGTGNAISGNANGGDLAVTLGAGVGTGTGGSFNLAGGTGGGTAGTGSSINLTAGAGGAGGVGGNIKLAPGAAGAGGKTGNIVIAGSGRIVYAVNATTAAPTCSSTGIGGAGTCGLANYSTDTSGLIGLTPAAGVAALGTVTLTFNQSIGANGGMCVVSLQTGSATWNPRATVIVSSVASATATILWDNNSIALTAASSYQIGYYCTGRQ